MNGGVVSGHEYPWGSGGASPENFENVDRKLARPIPVEFCFVFCFVF